MCILILNFGNLSWHFIQDRNIWWCMLLYYAIIVGNIKIKLWEWVIELIYIIIFNISIFSRTAFATHFYQFLIIFNDDIIFYISLICIINSTEWWWWCTKDILSLGEIEDKWEKINKIQQTLIKFIKIQLHL